MSDGRIVIDSVFNDRPATQGISKLQKSMQNVGSKMKSVGSTMSKAVTVPLVGLGTASVATAVKFDDSMRKVRATMGNNLGKTTKEQEKNFNRLREEAKRLGSTTRYSASEAAAGMEKLALAGWDTNQIMAATEPMLNLAAAAGMNLDRAADIVTDTMSAFGMEASQATHATDVFAAAMSKSNTDVDQLGEAMKYVSAAAKASGMDLEQTVAILGKFADQGIKGSMAGTTLASMLRDVKKSAKDGKIAVGDTSIAVYDANGKMRDMTSILADVEKATAGMSDEQRDAALSSVFQQEALKGVNILLQTGTGKVKDFEKELRNSDGTAAAMKDTMEGGLGGSIRSLMSALEGLAISLGEVIAPHVKKLADFLAILAQKFSNLPTGVKEAIVVIAAIAAAIGPLLVILGTLVSSITTLTPLFAGLSVPIWPLIAVLGALVAAGVLVWQNWETISQKAQEIWSAIWSLIQPIVSNIQSFIQEKMDMVKKFWEENGDQILEAAKNVWGFISKVIESAMEIIGNIMKVLWPVIEVLIVGTWEAIKNVINGAINIILGVIKTFSSLFTGDWKGVWEGAKQIIKGALELIWGWVQLFGIGRLLKLFAGLGAKLLKPITKMWGDIKKVFSDALAKIWGWIKGKFESIVSTVSNKMTSVKNKISSVWTAIKKFFSDALSSIWNTVKGIFEKIFSSISSKMEAAKSKISSILNSVKSFFSSILSSIWSTVKGKFQGIVSAVSSSMNSVLSKIKSIWGKVKSFFSGINLYKIGKDIIQGLINGIGSMANAVWKKAKSIADGVTKNIKKALHIASPSKVMIQMGKWTGEGLEIGMDDSVKGIDKAADNLAAAAIPDLPDLSGLASSVLTAPGIPSNPLNSSDIMTAIQNLANAVLNQPLEIEVSGIQSNLNINGRQFATAMNKPITQAQQRQSFRDKRRYK
ncbi:phage tail tape measure protein [Bacillus spizizenii]|nr:phage tail tape measure protein [Bacillus spizizenii]MCY8907072.1 phage tail tape measure protein [Bacillus spizizenii]